MGVNLSISLETLKRVGGEALALRRADKIPLTISFLQAGVPVELPSGSQGRLGIKETITSDPLLVVAPEWVQSGIGSSSSYTFDVDLDTTELLTALGDQSQIAGVMEIQWTVDGYRYSSVSVPVLITQNIFDSSALPSTARTKASTAEAEAGTDNTKWMTPLRTAEAIAELGGNVFDSNGDLIMPANGGIVFDRADTQIRVGMGFHIRSGEGVSIEAVDQTDPENPIIQGWYFSPDGTLTSPNGTIANTYQQQADPGAVGAGKLWLRLNSDANRAYVDNYGHGLYIRNTDNTAWNRVAPVDFYDNGKMRGFCTIGNDGQVAIEGFNDDGSCKGTLVVGNQLWFWNNGTNLTYDQSGQLSLYATNSSLLLGTSTGTTTISGTPTAQRTLTLPDADGTLALTNQVATLDQGGKIPVAQLPSSLMQYLGAWNAATNTPELSNATGVAGSVYNVTVAGVRDIGGGEENWGFGDWAIFNGTTWERSPNADDIVSVNGKTGSVTLNASDVGAAASTHTHALSNLTQSSATTGQVASWNGTAWVPTTPAAAGVSSVNGKTGAAVLSASDVGAAASNHTHALNSLSIPSGSVGQVLTYVPSGMSYAWQPTTISNATLLVYSAGANTAIAATDTIAQAFGKTQGQLNAKVSTDGAVTSISKLTQAQYNALTPKVATTLYLIVG